PGVFTGATQAGVGEAQAVPANRSNKTFVLDSQAWSGVVTVDQDGATITPRDDPEAAWLARGPHRAAARMTVRVTRALAAAGGLTVPAARGVVVWGTFPQRVATSGEVTFVAGEHLHDWLLGQRACLNRTQLAALSAANAPSLFAGEARPV
ncbi:MAG: Nuclease-related protein, partial [Streptosporangiaceae bacterium]|nr:Nuclease-related protein [Streptosporangiaceae bacterium]